MRLAASGRRSQHRSENHEVQGTVASRAYVIGLEDGYRGAHLEAQLHDAGILPTRVRALDARRLSPGETAKYYDAVGARVLLRREMSAGEVGCAISHQLAHAQALEQQEGDWTLFFEDDARLTQHFRMLPDLLARLPVEVPAIFVLWALPGYGIVARRSVTEHSGVRLARAVVPPIWAGAYVMNRRAIELACSRSFDRVDFVADWPPTWSYDTRFFLAHPWLAQPADVPSTLQMGRSVPESFTESRWRKGLRHLAAGSGLTYLRNRRRYVSLRSYLCHEVVRPVVYLIARHRDRRLGDDPRSPVVL